MEYNFKTFGNHTGIEVNYVQRIEVLGCGVWLMFSHTWRAGDFQNNGNSLWISQNRIMCNQNITLSSCSMFLQLAAYCPCFNSTVIAQLPPDNSFPTTRHSKILNGRLLSRILFRTTRNFHWFAGPWYPKPEIHRKQLAADLRHTFIMHAFKLAKSHYRCCTFV